MSETMTIVTALALLFVVTGLAPTFNLVLPIRPTLMILSLSQIAPWWMVGLVASAGGTLGALPLYAVAEKAVDVKSVHRWLRHKYIAWLFRFLQGKMFLTLVLIVLTPLPDQLLGLSGGAEKYPVKKFLLANFVGRLLFYVPLAFVAAYFHAEISAAWHWLLNVVGF